MTIRKKRLTVTVDAAYVKEAEAAVRAGDAASVSAWVNEALSKHSERERRFAAMATAIAEYETAFGKFTDAELEAQRRADRRNAIVVRRGRKPKRGRAA